MIPREKHLETLLRFPVGIFFFFLGLTMAGTGLLSGVLIAWGVLELTFSLRDFLFVIVELTS